ncbi:FAD/NAD(P)-binding protein [Bordetella genomosp. 13]|uniref:FAD/NAD(P)-binding protein n=1 Tax=Bordetella genomosp. 13 TaxID=463040 RepID=UPI0011A79FDB|nr:FAD/NAD(P)-binding protein [Bordetella genomosp. 13]
MQRDSGRLAIVGGGSVAVSFLYQFLEEWPAGRPLEVALFEPRPEVGPGGAYQADLASNLLNIPVSRMSAVATDRDSFLNWLRARDPAWLRAHGVQAVEPSAFLPRPVFGSYLRDLYDQALASARRKGVTVRRIAQAVVGVWPLPCGHAAVLGEGGERVVAHRVVLCNGNLPSTAFPELAPLPGYFNSPYPVSDLCGRIGRDDAVCIVGTSLSAIDAIVALRAQGHRGQVHCVSRNGRLPAVRSPHNTAVSLPLLPEPEPDGRVTLDGLLDSLRRALRAAGGREDHDDILGLAGAARDALDAEIARSQAGPRPWQSVAAATNDRIEHIWHALDDAERRRFHRDWRTLWMARRATFPMRNALTLQQALHEGSLHVHGGFRGARYDAALGVFKVQAGDGRPELGAPWLVNATSFSMDVETSADPLVRQLCGQGHARAHPLGGFDLDFDTGCLRDRDGRRVAQVSVLGSLAAGTYFWTTSMEINMRLAHGQAMRLARACTWDVVPA